MAQDGTDLIPEPGPDDHVRGSLDAPVVITEFGDFECPYCGEAYRTLETLREQYGSRVALVFRHFPLPMHPHAPAAAIASEVAARAGKFWEMYDQLFRHQDALTDADLRKYAETIGIDSAHLASASKQGTFRESIERDVQSGEASGIEGTPSLFINGFAYEGESSVEELGEAIELALTAKAGAAG